MGNDISTEDVTKKVLSTALAVSYFTPAAALTVPATAVIGAVGVSAKITGHLSDDDDWKEAGNFLGGIALDATIDGVAGGAVDGVKKCGQLAKLAKVGCEGYNSVMDDAHRLSGKPFIPTPDPQTILFAAKNIKYMF